MFLLGRLEQEVPLSVSEEGPARGGIPAVRVEEATEGTGADELSSVKSHLHVWIGKQTERSLGAALLVDRRRDGQQAVCQHAGALPEKL